jgi:two-component system, OmpR family, sensor kinase
VLAAAAVAEGLLAVWALSVAERQVQRGRVASDIQLGFVELSATKQRLRTWVSQMQLGAEAEPAQRDRLQADMRRSWQRLQTLSQRAIALDVSDATRFEHVQRQDALAVLQRSLEELEGAVGRAKPLVAGADARQAWQALSQVFDVSLGCATCGWARRQLWRWPHCFLRFTLRAHCAAL